MIKFSKWYSISNEISFFNHIYTIGSITCRFKVSVMDSSEGMKTNFIHGALKINH